ncbi:MAG: ABC transporter substrate-binding protein [Deltaproteobacteria bacterium]|nr:ABC transporter substrate-binding protein [Deltaproteobacteria bacterium]MBI3078736.1 ABC transporter substrate-binding protein [Deltaproteobacteria bacterium]
MARRTLGLLALLPTLLLSASIAAAQDRIAIRANFLLSSDEGFFFAAIEKGFYREQGIEARVLRGFGSADTLKKMHVTGEPFGVSDALIVVKARAEGLKVRIIGNQLDQGPSTIYALKSSGIRTVKDLEGKRFGDAAGAVGTLLLPVFCRYAKVDCAKIKVINVQPAVKRTMLLGREIDATHDFWFSGVVAMRQKARAQGDDIVTFRHKDYYSAYGPMLVARDDVIQQKPDLVRRYLRATYEGVRYTVQHPEESVQILFKYVPEADRETSLEELVAFNESILSAEVKARGFGLIREDRMRATRDIAMEIFGIAREIPTAELYTDQLVPSLKP